MTDYDLAAFTRDVTSARDEWRKGTRWPCGADARLSADLDYRQAVSDAAERLLSATRTALAVQQRATTDAIGEAGRLSGQLDAARQALDEATSERDEARTNAEWADSARRSTLDELAEVQSERDEALAAAAELREALANPAMGRTVTETAAPSPDGQGAAPEPPPAPPLPVRKPRSPAGASRGRPRSAAEPRPGTEGGSGDSRPSEASTTARKGGAR